MTQIKVKQEKGLFVFWVATPVYKLLYSEITTCGALKQDRNAKLYSFSPYPQLPESY